MKCSVCGKQKHNIEAKQSRLLKQNMLFCKECWEKGYEPRHIIIIISRSKGTDKVAKYIKNKLYYGEEIKGSELI